MSEIIKYLGSVNEEVFYKETVSQNVSPFARAHNICVVELKQTILKKFIFCLFVCLFVLLLLFFGFRDKC